MHTILVVDDEERLRRALGRSLSLEGCRTFVARSGEEALGIVKEKKVDLIITDLAMPGMDGMALVRTVKKDRPDLRTIILTAYGTPDSRQEAEALGVDCFLAKPFDLSGLKARVAELLPHRPAPVGPAPVRTVPARTASSTRVPTRGKAAPRKPYGVVGLLCFRGGRTVGMAALLTRKTTSCLHPMSVLYGLGKAAGSVSRFTTKLVKDPVNLIPGLGAAGPHRGYQRTTGR
jgi:CheY-like chemotaxis protein